MKPTIGRIVIFRLTAEQAGMINRRRTCGQAIAVRIERNSSSETHWPMGAQAHIGMAVNEGEEFPCIITKVNSFGVNGQVVLDGNDVFWVMNIEEGNENGQWHWPEIKSK